MSEQIPPPPATVRFREPGTVTTSLPRVDANMPIDSTLIPGRTIRPIDLVNVLRLAGVRNLDIALARQQVNQALAEMQRTRSLWLPSLFLGPTYYRADGQVQTVQGQVINVNRSSLFLGGTAATVNGFPAPAAGTGYPQLNSLSSVMRISDAIFEPLAAQRATAASRAAVQVRTNDALLQVAEGYLDLQQAAGRLAIAREAADNAGVLTSITAAYARTGEGREADHRRALVELRRQRNYVQQASGQLLIASTDLVRLLVLDPRLVVAPLEPAETPLRLVPEETPLDELIVLGLRRRPELAQSRELVEAAIIRAKQARLRPYIPSVATTYAGGGLGGGQGEFFGNFGARGDFMASLFWELQHLGFSDRAIMRRTDAERRSAAIQLQQIEQNVAADVAAAFALRAAAARQIEECKAALVDAIESHELNAENLVRGAGLPRATRPLEVLQPIQALAQARLDYLEAVLSYNRAQFRLKRAIGEQP
ncbi:MAG TPA: TolC family protein [Pirellulales bacterium]|nr:TolC family protein [Pirellulales bacterium]